MATSDDPVPRRRYDSTRRQQGATETRERILAAGCELLGEVSIRDWRGLTIRAVADRAGVNERTVYRHFTNERGLRDAVMRRLEQQAGIDLDDLDLAGVADVARRIFTTVASHPLEPRPPTDPTFAATSEREREALLRAVRAQAADWAERDAAVAAAMLNALWRVSVYEHLAVDWELDEAEAIAGITWVIDLIEDAVRNGRTPSASAPLRRPRPPGSSR
jgi:AcrR family transcriptional regulator